MHSTETRRQVRETRVEGEGTPKVYLYNKRSFDYEDDPVNKERFTEVKVKTTKVPIERSWVSEPAFKNYLLVALVITCILLPAFLLSSLISPHHPHNVHHSTEPIAPFDSDFKTFVKEGLTNIQDRLDSTVSRDEFKGELDRERKERTTIREMIMDLKSQDYITKDELERSLSQRLPSADPIKIKDMIEEALDQKSSEIYKPILKKAEEAQRGSIERIVQETYNRLKSELTSKGAEKIQKLGDQVNIETYRPQIMKWIKESIQSEIPTSNIFSEDTKKTVVESLKNSLAHALPTRNEISDMIEDSLTRFAADQVALPDFALASAGADIVLSRTSSRYLGNHWLLSMLLPFGVSHPPSVILQPEVVVGKCWAFPGSHGNITIRLSEDVDVESVTLDHVDHRIAHHVESAPRGFNVWGFKNLLKDKGTLLGSFNFDVFSSTKQTFQTERKGVFRFITVEITSNYGHPDFACLYRFRVHGKAAHKKASTTTTTKAL